MMLSMDLLWGVLKWMYVLAFGLYVGFSVVILSQVRQMTSTLSGGVEKQAILFGWIHFGLSVVAMLWAIVVI